MACTAAQYDQTCGYQLSFNHCISRVQALVLSSPALCRLMAYSNPKRVSVLRRHRLLRWSAS
jgi:hypothetical protein